MIAVMVLCPSPALRAGIQALLSGDPEIAVVAQAAHWGAEADEPLPAEAQVLIVTPGGVDGEAFPIHLDLALLWVDDSLPEWLDGDGMDARVWGAIAPDATAEALQAAVRALAQGLLVVTPEIWQRWAARSDNLPVIEDVSDAPDVLDRLTGRETDVLRLLAQGLTNKQIALSLAISEHTVKFHISSLYSKLGVNSRMEAARKGALNGLIPL